MIIQSVAGKAADFYQTSSQSPTRTTGSGENIRAIATQSTGNQPARTEAPRPEQVREAVEQIQQFTQNWARNLNFSLDDETGKTVVKVVDTQTSEVIRQIPTEEAIDIARALGKLQGILVNDKA